MKRIKLETTELLGRVLSRLLVVENYYQTTWDKNEEFRNHKTRLAIKIDIRELLDQLNAQGIEDYFICDYSKIGNDW